jgi:hypothetical protein
MGCAAHRVHDASAPAGVPAAWLLDASRRWAESALDGSSLVLLITERMPRATSKDRLWVATRLPGRRFSRARPLWRAPRPIFAYDVAIAPGGRAILAWASHGRRRAVHALTFGAPIVRWWGLRVRSAVTRPSGEDPLAVARRRLARL